MSSAALDTRHLNTWVEVSAAAYAHNLRFFRQRIGAGVELSAVVKSNAYGHGLEVIAPLAVRHGADSFCVHALDEALALRRAGFSQPILVMGHVPLLRLGEALEHDLRLVLYNPETLARLDERTVSMSRGPKARPVRVHLKLETGTYRQGVDEAGLPALLAALGARPQVVLEGAYTHFADIEDTTDHTYAHAQLERFQRMVATVKAAGHADLRLHAACSAATLLFPSTHLDMVRLGVSQYGLWPSKETYVSYLEHHGRTAAGVLRPVLSWKTRVSQVKSVPADGFIGYGRTYQTTRDSRIAVLPVGYADGYDRKLSNRGAVLIGGRRAPVRGRVCMNLTMVDVTDIPDVALEDEVVLLGRQGEREVSAEAIAGLVGTIPYEIVSRISPTIPRLVVEPERDGD